MKVVASWGVDGTMRALVKMFLTAAVIDERPWRGTPAPEGWNAPRRRDFAFAFEHLLTLVE